MFRCIVHPDPGRLCLKAPRRSWVRFLWGAQDLAAASQLLRLNREEVGPALFWGGGGKDPHPPSEVSAIGSKKPRGTQTPTKTRRLGQCPLNFPGDGMGLSCFAGSLFRGGFKEEPKERPLSWGFHYKTNQYPIFFWSPDSAGQGKVPMEERATHGPFSQKVFTRELMCGRGSPILAHFFTGWYISQGHGQLNGFSHGLLGTSKNKNNDTSPTKKTWTGTDPFSTWKRVHALFSC